jgi:hypothetical protein
MASRRRRGDTADKVKPSPEAIEKVEREDPEKSEADKYSLAIARTLLEATARYERTQKPKGARKGARKSAKKRARKTAKKSATRR